LCKYETDRKRDFDRHNISTKHVKNEFNQSGCSDEKKPKKKCIMNIDKDVKKDNCSDKSDTQSSDSEETKSRYINLIKNIKNIDDGKHLMATIVTELESTIKQLKNENDTLKMTSDKMLNIIDKMSHTPIELQSNKIINNTTAETIINNNNSLIANTINVQHYINENYTNVKPIMILKPSKITKMLNDDIKDKKSIKDRTIEDYLIYYESKYALHVHLSDIIVKEYRKDNPHDQQIWSTNVKTLTFIIRKILNDSGVWSKDAHGVDVTSKIIKPFLNEIQNILIKYVKNTNYILDTEEIDKQYNNVGLANRIITNINNKKLHKQILKTIAEKFQLRFDKEIEINDKDKI
jgi:hypothetical protein